MVAYSSKEYKLHDRILQSAVLFRKANCMPKVRYSCQDIDIDHANLLKLWKAKNLNLGISEAIAIKIAEAPHLKPKKIAAAGAFHFWNWVAVGIFAFSIYASITMNWWWFISGFIVKRIIWKANKKSNSQNLLDAAFIDQEFYEKVKSVKGWIYKLDESVAEAFVRK